MSSPPPDVSWRQMSDLPEDFQTAHLAEIDPDIARVLDGELGRQQGTLEMIASENFVPQAVLDAAGSVLTNKYAEGLPGKRYYGGCGWGDQAEQLSPGGGRGGPVGAAGTAPGSLGAAPSPPRGLIKAFILISSALSSGFLS